MQNLVVEVLGAVHHKLSRRVLRVNENHMYNLSVTILSIPSTPV